MRRSMAFLLSLAIGIGGHAEEEPSGAHWCPRFFGSNSLNHLHADFRPSARNFIDALRDAGANVKIASTMRPDQRQYLMYWSWQIFKEKYFLRTIKPCVENNLSSDCPWTWFPPSVPAYEDKTVEILWYWSDGHWVPCTISGCYNNEHKHVHQLETCINAARDMVVGYTITSKPARASRHSLGKAIDMVISWVGELRIKNKGGEITTISSQPRDGSNMALHVVGASYGVRKLVSGCSNHWSDNGH